MAPGVDILSTTLNNNYDSQDGTSFAAPQVTGVAALILSVRPDLTGTQVRDIIEQTAQKVGGYSYTTHSGKSNGTWHEQMGYGLVNAYEAVKKALLHGVSISGPSAICEQATYTIENLPPGATVQWSTGNSNLTLISGQGTDKAIFKKSGNGRGLVEATINNSISLSYSEITVGVPDFSKIQIHKLGSNNSEMCIDYPNEFYVTYNNQISPLTEEVLEYEWILSGSWNIIENPAAETGGKYPRKSIVVIVPQTPHLGWGSNTYVAIRARNACGWCLPTPSIVYKNQNCKGYFSLYPNPASNEVTIELTNIGNISNRSMNSPSPASAYEIQLWSAASLLRTYKTDRLEYQISVSDLPAGIYFVRVIKNGEVYTRKLIKN